MTNKRVCGGAILAVMVLGIAPAMAQVKDEVYRGTLVCSPLPFVKGYLRAAMEVTIKGNAAEYKQPVINPEKGTLIGTETGSGTLNGQAIKLSGGWKGSQPSYEATYSGSFVRRSARLTGTQVWTYEGKTYTRTCAGAVKRPLAIFKRGTRA